MVQGKTTYLSKVPLFSGLSPADIGRLARIVKREEYGRNTIIFDEKAAGDRFYIVVSGRVKIYASSGMRKKTLAYLEPGEFFGEMALLDLEPRSASSVALETSELLVIEQKDFKKLIERYPRLSLAVIKTLCLRLRQADREIEALAFGNVVGRVASTLLELAARYGKIIDRGCRIDVQLSHKDIAELAGTGREMVSRTLNRFRRIKCIEYEERHLIITNASKLKSLIY